MLALAMILTAAMMVPGNGPEKASGDVTGKKPGLDLKGKWEGDLSIQQPDGSPLTVPVTYQDGKLASGDSGEAVVMKLVFIDEGEGKCRCRNVGADQQTLGIYKWKREQLFICFNEDGKGRPTNFTAKGANCLLTLHRVKPCK